MKTMVKMICTVFALVIGAVLWAISILAVNMILKVLFGVAILSFAKCFVCGMVICIVSLALDNLYEIIKKV